MSAKRTFVSLTIKIILVSANASQHSLKLLPIQRVNYSNLKSVNEVNLQNEIVFFNCYLEKKYLRIASQISFTSLCNSDGKLGKFIPRELSDSATGKL